MPPRRASAPKQRSAKRKQSASVRKSTKPAPSIKTTRARAGHLLDKSIDHSTSFKRNTRSSTKAIQARVGRSLKTAAVHSNSLEPVQQSLTVFQNPTEPLQSARQKRDRELEIEEKPSNKRSRIESEFVVEWVQQLNKANLEEHNSQAGLKAFDGMNSRKRTVSTRSSVTDMDQEVTSVSSQRAPSLANYRWKNLKYARIFVENEPIPKIIESQVDAIIQPEISTEWRSELVAITETFCNEFIDVLEGASREDDCVEPIHHALKSIDRENEFMFPRKADWDVTLKPNVQRKPYSLSIPVRPDDAADSSLNRPSMPQQEQTADVFPNNLESMLPPPQPSSTLVISVVKTPRPDITAGLRNQIVIEKMEAQGLCELEIKDFLNDLQDQQILCSNPLQSAQPLCFPPMIVEGKAYATGKPMFEAQNQAAVSGSCMINLQHKLAELTELASPGSCRGQKSLAFSICTEGTIMQLWVHYSRLVKNVRIYQMSALRICQISSHTFLRQGVLDFFKAVFGVMRWATSEFVNEIVEELILLWKSRK